MRIAYIATGAAGMICGTCIHDNTLAAALQKKGHDVALIPTYTPIRTDEESVSIDRIFYGGLNVYLQEKIRFFRRTPGLIDNLFNSKSLLNWVSKFGSSTDAKDLGRLTVSVLKGEEGNQRKELRKLVEWLKEEYKPDIVQLNHSLLLGFATEIKRHLQVPVLCGAQGEDLFLENLIEPYKSQALELLRRKGDDIDALIATSEYYADFMARYLNLNRNKVHSVNLGIKLEGYGDDEFKLKSKAIIIGYLARLCPEKGLHLLVEAFQKLWKKLGSNKIQLKIAGYLGKKDEKYFDEIKNQIKSWGMQDAFEYVGEVDRLGKIVFLNTLDIFSVPTIYQEPKGLSILEAMANGVPVVQPKHGSFPEIIAKTGGGILVEPKSVDALADGLESLINDTAHREKLGRDGKEAVHRSFGDANMADAILAVYQQYLNKDALSSPGAKTQRHVENSIIQ